MRDLNLMTGEEMVLLVKVLGKESAEDSKCIRAVCYFPYRGFRMIWDRLDAFYRACDVIEEALFQRINGFPKNSNRDYLKLHEFIDLLMELETAKKGGDL